MTSPPTGLGPGWATDPPPPPWLAEPEPRPPRRDPLTRDEIVRAALRLLDRGGLESLTMRALAAELDTSPASLYARVRSKDELFDLVLDEVFAELEVPVPGGADWQEQLMQVSRDARRLFGRHRDLALVALGHVPSGPNFVVFFEKMLALLRSAELPSHVCAYAGNLLGSFVHSFAVEDCLRTRVDPASSGGSQDALAGYLESLPPERFPNIAALAGLIRSFGMDERFELGIEVILRGIASFSTPS